MIKQLKMGFKLMKYAYGLKSCLIAGAFMLVMGILMECYFGGENQATGILFIMLTAMWPLQLLYSINVANLAVASPCKKKIQTSVSAITNLVCFLVMYLVALGIIWINYKNQNIAEWQAVIRLGMVSVSTIILMLFTAAALKYFWISLAMFLIIFWGTMFSFQIASYSCQKIFEIISIEAASLMGLVAVVIGTLLQYGVSLLLYKKPVSKYAQLSALRKKM